MATVALFSDEEVSAKVLTIFNVIRAVKGTDHVSNFWRASAHDPVLLMSIWERLKADIVPGTLDEAFEVCG